jgi:hypothetical protein
MLDAKRLHAQAAESSDVVALWSKAVELARDAAIPELSCDTALQAAYAAGLTGALALLAAHQLRASSGRGHHEVVFAAASELGGHDLADLVPESEQVRSLRGASLYDPVIATEADRQHALSWMRRTLPAIRTALLTRHPDLASRLTEAP